MLCTSKIYFNAIKENYAEKAVKREMSIECFLNIFADSNSKIDIYTGEAHTFIDKVFLDGFYKIVSDKISKNNSFEVNVVCGNKILGIKDEETEEVLNPFIKLLEDLKEKYVDNINVYYNYFDLGIQFKNGYIHSIIVDGGKYIYLENSHDYSNLLNINDTDIIESCFFENAYDLGAKLSLKYKSYIDGLDYSDNDFNLINENTFVRSDFQQFNNEYAAYLKNLSAIEEKLAGSMPLLA